MSLNAEPANSHCVLHNIMSGTGRIGLDLQLGSKLPFGRETRKQRSGQGFRLSLFLQDPCVLPRIVSSRLPVTGCLCLASHISSSDLCVESILTAGSSRICHFLAGSSHCQECSPAPAITFVPLCGAEAFSSSYCFWSS